MKWSMLSLRIPSVRAGLRKYSICNAPRPSRQSAANGSSTRASRPSARKKLCIDARHCLSGPLMTLLSDPNSIGRAMRFLQNWK
jgi:hypothetical protein